MVAYFDELPYMNQTGFRFSSRERIRQSLTTLDHEDKYMPVGAKLLDYPYSANSAHKPLSPLSLRREGS